MIYNIISSGSQGNAILLENEILIDCGVNFKKLKECFLSLKLVLLTHIHSDHFNRNAIRKLAFERPSLYFVAPEWLVNELVICGVSYNNILKIEAGKIYDLKFCKIAAIKLYHDVPNVGYRIYINGEKALYITDTSHVSGIYAKNYNLYLIEANYGEDEIKERIKIKEDIGKYCYERSVPLRHLSKEQADEFLLNNMGDNSEYEYIHKHKEEKQ